MPKKKIQTKEDLPSSCEKCPYFKHEGKDYCYNPPEHKHVDVEARVIFNRKRRASWCRLKKKVEDYE